jgi:hypothetical protein
VAARLKDLRRPRDCRSHGDEGRSPLVQAPHVQKLLAYLISDTPLTGANRRRPIGCLALGSLTWANDRVPDGTCQPRKQYMYQARFARVNATPDTVSVTQLEAVLLADTASTSSARHWTRRLPCATRQYKRASRESAPSRGRSAGEASLDYECASAGSDFSEVQSVHSRCTPELPASIGNY